MAKHALRIAVSGAHGLVGSYVVEHLKKEGHQVNRLLRGNFSQRPDIGYDVDRGAIDGPSLEEVDVVIHLAGKNIASSRWTPAVKEALEKSRIESTKLIAKGLGRTEKRPKLFLCASAIGYYGDCGEEWVSELHAPGLDFLAVLCQKWESATAEAAQAGVRVVNMRFGHVITSRGGLLGRLLPFFRLGLGASFGSGEQYWSWVSLPDLARAISFLIEQESISGPANFCAPHPIKQAALADALAKVLGRPRLFSIPGPLVHALLGEAAQSLLQSCRARPDVLLKAGFSFEQDTVEKALRVELVP